MKFLSYVNLADKHKMPLHIIGKGKPVVLLHGFGMDAKLWLPYILPYSHKFKFYLPYLRGFGAANPVSINQKDTLANYVNDLEDLVQQFKLEQFLLGGISLGALTALKWQQTGQSWENVERYLHIDQSPTARNAEGWPHGLFGEDQDRMFNQFNALLDSVSPYKDQQYMDLPADLRTQMRQVLGSFFEYGLSKTSHKRVARLVLINDNVASKFMPMQCWWNYVMCMQSYLESPYDFRESLRTCKTPITLFTGMRSKMYPAQGQISIQGMAQDVNVVRFYRSGHIPLLDEPLKFTRELGRFLNAKSPVF